MNIIPGGKMGEIKFRAWDKSNECMFSPTSLTFNEDGELIYVGLNPESLGDLQYDEVELMQYTGLKDKNGRKIYEGDILKWDDETGVVTFGELPWDKGGDCTCSYQAFYAEAIKAYFKCNGIFDYQEVIGNIYENRDLLSVPEKP